MTLILHDGRPIKSNIYNFGFDKHPMFTTSVILLMVLAKFSFHKAKDRIDYKPGFSSAEINFFKQMIPVMVSNRYRSRKKKS